MITRKWGHSEGRGLIICAVWASVPGLLDGRFPAPFELKIALYGEKVPNRGSTTTVYYGRLPEKAETWKCNLNFKPTTVERFELG